VKGEISRLLQNLAIKNKLLVREMIKEGLIETLAVLFCQAPIKTKYDIAYGLYQSCFTYSTIETMMAVMEKGGLSIFFSALQSCDNKGILILIGLKGIKKMLSCSQTTGLVDKALHTEILNQFEDYGGLDILTNL